MRRAFLIVLIVIVAVTVGVWFARQRLVGRNGAQPGPTVAAPPASTPGAPSDDGAEVQAGCDDVADAVRSVLRSGSAFPSGTRLASLTVQDGVCVVGLSPEISGVNDLGSTGESEAQNALRAALARFDRISTMRVTVGDVTFEGSHSGEWDDIPVRGGPAPEGTDP